MKRILALLAVALAFAGVAGVLAQSGGGGGYHC